ncbi:MAG: protein translocase subunit SecF [Xanthomonadales bacterium]|nr:protein translocase subunit SecF [Xanthomonadales bacterium]
MQFLTNTHIDFMRQRWLAIAFSSALIVIGLGSLITKGLNFGLDFTGGTLIEVVYAEAPKIADIRNGLATAGFDDVVVQTFGSSKNIVVRLAAEGESSDAELSSMVLAALGDGVEMRRVEFVGPQIGDELAEQGGLAMLWVLAGIFVYIMFRFQWRFSVGAVLALVHDVLVTVGILSLLQIEFDLTVVAALLAVIGYSLNDTIVLYDRIRENFRRLRKDEPSEVVNTSINQTLARTLVTSLTTIMVLVSLFYFGGEIIHSFAFTLLAGVIVGTYSSIYVASTAILQLGVSKQDLMDIVKENPEIDALP